MDIITNEKYIPTNLNQEIVTLYYMNLIICYVEFKVRKIECIFDCKLYEIGEQIQFSTEISP